MVMKTMMAEDHPMAVIIGMPETWRPAMARITVTPANSTASPAVALARPTASATGIPSSRFCRYRVRMKRE